MDTIKIAVKYFGIILIILGIMLPMIGWGIKYDAYNQTPETAEEMGEKLRQLDFAEYLMKWCQILVLAGIGLIILTVRRY